MFDLAALSLQTATPAPLSAPSASSGSAVESVAPSFEALLALQIVPAEPADVLLPEGGKTLPDPAKAVAALPLVLPTDAITEPGLAKVPADVMLPVDKADGADEDASPGPAIVLPDAGWIASVLAAPRPLAASSDQQDAAAAPSSPSSPSIIGVQTLRTNAATRPIASSATPSVAALAIAQSARIEIAPDTAEAPPAIQSVAAPATPTTQIIASRQLRQAKSTDATGDSAPGDNRPATVSSVPLPADRQPAEAPRVEAASSATLLADRAPVAPNSTLPAPAPSHARSERIDFATLVDTLARAREDAAPRAVTASVNHAEFGRITMRFDADQDRGMSVALSSADPGFARAVTVATEPARTPSEGSGQNPQPQADTRSFGGQGESPRQQPRQAEQAPARPFADNRAASASDEAPGPRRDDGGIYA